MFRPVAYEIRELNITTDGELTFVHRFKQVSGTLASATDLWLR